MKIYIVWSRFVDDPSLIVAVCQTEEKAKDLAEEIHGEYKEFEVKDEKLTESIYLE